MVGNNIERLLAQDLSKGSERFRDALLRECLAVLGADGGNPTAEAEGSGEEVDDDCLDMLAAAGDRLDMAQMRPLGDNVISSE